MGRRFARWRWIFHGGLGRERHCGGVASITLTVRVQNDGLFESLPSIRTRSPTSRVSKMNPDTRSTSRRRGSMRTVTVASSPESDRRKVESISVRAAFADYRPDRRPIGLERLAKNPVADVGRSRPAGHRPPQPLVLDRTRRHLHPPVGLETGVARFEPSMSTIAAQRWIWRLTETAHWRGGRCRR